MKNINPLITLIAGIVLFFIPLSSIQLVLSIYLIIIGVLGLVNKGK